MEFGRFQISVGEVGSIHSALHSRHVGSTARDVCVRFPAISTRYNVISFQLRTSLRLLRSTNVLANVLVRIHLMDRVLDRLQSIARTNNIGCELSHGAHISIW